MSPLFKPLLLLLGLSSALNVWAVPPQVVLDAWRPPAILLADGDNTLAIKRMREYTSLQQTVFKNVELHPQTQKFVDEVWSSIESFNLDGFYDILPEKVSDGRQLRVYGALVKDTYLIGPVPNGGMSEAGVPKTMGQMSARIHASEVEDPDQTKFLLKGDLQLGIGDIPWQSVQKAAMEGMRIMVGQQPTLHRARNQWQREFRMKAKTMNPKLTEEDIDIVAPLWASFPAIWELLSHFGEIEDIIYHDTGLPYRRFTGSFRLVPETMEKHYPHLTRHMEALKKLFQGSFSLGDDRGELISGEINSETLRGHLQMYIAEGRIVPVTGNKVLVNAPPIPDNQPWSLHAKMQAALSVWGVDISLQNASARMQFISKENEFRLVSQITEVPKVMVDGNALGLFPTWMADIVLPKSFKEIIEEFLVAACRGNNGKGVLAGIHFQSNTGEETSNLVLKGAFEGLQNFFVRFGMSIVNHRVIPEEGTSRELERLFYEIQEAFSSDLKGFESAIAEAEGQASNSRTAMAPVF